MITFPLFILRLLSLVQVLSIEDNLHGPRKKKKRKEKKRYLTYTI